MAYLARKAMNLLAGMAMLFELKNAFGVSPGTDPPRNSTDATEYRFENSPGFSAILWSFSPVFIWHIIHAGIAVKFCRNNRRMRVKLSGGKPIAALS